MSDEEDDYLSDKFLLQAASASTAEPKTYSRIRKQAQKEAQLKNEQNRIKSRRERELEAREEGLRKSLFERAKEEEEAGLSSGNKALSIMMKMGFKPGQSLGNTEEGQEDTSATHESSLSKSDHDNDKEGTPGPSQPTDRPTTIERKPRHAIVPLPVDEWTGKKGIGLGKRARSPSVAERTAKMAKMADETSHQDFRDRARHEYQERRAEAKLGPAQRTCATLDERSGKSFNVLWLNPNNSNTFPAGLVDALALHGNVAILPEETGESMQSRLRRQMQADALQDKADALEDIDDPHASADEIKSLAAVGDQFNSEALEEATQFLRLHAQDRLQLVVNYLRDRYAYCFWCGVEYKDEEEMESQCPGSEEDAHD